MNEAKSLSPAATSADLLFLFLPVDVYMYRFALVIVKKLRMIEDTCVAVVERRM